jgi:hypothetical protein
VLSAADPANPFAKATQVTDPTTNLQFPGNKIPLTRLDPAALSFTKYLPVSPSANGKYFYAIPLAQDFNEYLVRGDHTFSD